MVCRFSRDFIPQHYLSIVVGVCSLLARLSSDTTIIGPTVAASERAYDSADISSTLATALGIPLVILFVLFLLRALLRQEWAAAVAFVLFFTVFGVAGSPSAPVALVTRLIINGLAVFMLIRFGLLALVAAFVFGEFLEFFPLTTQGSAWYAGISLAGILLMAAMASYGFYTPRGADRFSEVRCLRSELPLELLHLSPSGELLF